MTRFIQLLLRICLPVLVLGCGVYGAVKLVKSRPVAKKNTKKNPPPLVETMLAAMTEEPIKVHAFGTVIPAQQIQVQAEVSGRLISLSRHLIPGGRFQKGESILHLDRRNYDFQVTQQKANVERAKLDLATEEGRKAIAIKEWSLLNKGRKQDSSNNPLALRIPHIQSALASVDSAKSALDQAKLNAQRTELTAPFNALVLEESVDRGQLINSQTKIATLVGTDQFLVRVSIPVSQLSSIALPDARGNKGSSVTVIQNKGDGQTSSRKGQVIRMLADLDPSGRMARLLIAIDRPMSTQNADGSPLLPLFLGSFVKVVINGKSLKQVVRVPRKALRKNDSIWVVSKTLTLENRDVQIAWRNKNTLLISSGLKAGDKIITSRLATPVISMPLRIDTLKNGKTGLADMDKASKGETQ
jgi:RND family efflux transporter MFP subunit